MDQKLARYDIIESLQLIAAADQESPQGSSLSRVVGGQQGLDIDELGGIEQGEG